MKKTVTLALSLLLAMNLLTGCSTAGAPVGTDPSSKDANQTSSQSSMEAETSTGNFTDEMKMAYAADLSPDDGADSVERQADVKNSPYFTSNDYYNMTSTDTLTILPKFQTIQQTSEWSCGVTSAMMVLNYYGKLGDWNEASLAELRRDNTPSATTLRQAMDIFDGVGGFTYTTTYDFEDLEQIDLTMIKDYLKDGVPVMIAWNDWGGHWQVIIGYDTMGTETLADDVIIVADPYDTTDHNQDGYGVYPAERFFYNWTMYDFFENDPNDKLFLAAKPVEE